MTGVCRHALIDKFIGMTSTSPGAIPVSSMCSWVGAAWWLKRAVNASSSRHGVFDSLPTHACASSCTGEALGSYPSGRRSSRRGRTEAGGETVMHGRSPRGSPAKKVMLHWWTGTTPPCQGGGTRSKLVCGALPYAVDSRTRDYESRWPRSIRGWGASNVTIMRYHDLDEGQCFVFDYPHHGEVKFPIVYRKLGDGYQRVDTGEVEPELPTVMSMPVRVVSAP